LARLVVDVDDGGDEGEGGEEQEEQGLDAKAGRGTARLVGTRLPGLGAVQLWNGKVLFCCLFPDPNVIKMRHYLLFIRSKYCCKLSWYCSTRIYY